MLLDGIITPMNPIGIWRVVHGHNEQLIGMGCRNLPQFRLKFFEGLGFAIGSGTGLFAGLEFMYTKQGFRKEPYGMKHYIRAARSFQTGSLHFLYNADFVHAIGHNDLLIRSDFRAPVNVTNFFGIGNNTVFDKNMPGKIQYYRTRYDIANVSVLLRKQMQSWMRVNFGPTFQYFSLDSTENAGKFVTNDFPALNEHGIYGRRSFVGGEVRLDINSKNNQMIPTRGFVLDLGLRPLIGINNISNNILQANVDMRIFMSLASQTRLVLATRVGWGKNYGKYEFPQAMYMGGTDNLRGFRKQRFAGRSMLFNNTELRIRLFDFNTYLFPGSFGLLVFHDIGRVWADGENSENWHNGYGGGIWIAPIRRFVVAAVVAKSKEEKMLPRITFGFQF